MLTKDQILEMDDRKVEELFVPEWDDSVRVMELGADDRDELEQYLAEHFSKKDKKDYSYKHIRAPLVAMSLVDEKGKRIFSLKDIPALGKKNGIALDRIFEVSNRLSKVFGLEKEDIKKNSSETQSE